MLVRVRQQPYERIGNGTIHTIAFLICFLLVTKLINGPKHKKDYNYPD